MIVNWKISGVWQMAWHNGLHSYPQALSYGTNQFIHIQTIPTTMSSSNSSIMNVSLSFVQHERGITAAELGLSPPNGPAPIREFLQFRHQDLRERQILTSTPNSTIYNERIEMAENDLRARPPLPMDPRVVQRIRRPRSLTPHPVSGRLLGRGGHQIPLQIGNRPRRRPINPNYIPIGNRASAFGAFRDTRRPQGRPAPVLAHGHPTPLFPPNNLPPGSFPPNHRPHGSFPPNHRPHGSFPPNHRPHGSFPPNHPPPGQYQQFQPAPILPPPPIFLAMPNGNGQGNHANPFVHFHSAPPANLQEYIRDRLLDFLRANNLPPPNAILLLALPL